MKRKQNDREIDPNKKRKMEDSFTMEYNPSMNFEKMGKEAKQIRTMKRQMKEFNNREDDDDERVEGELDYKVNTRFSEEGIVIEPFNLDAEREEGYFDEYGNYIERKDKSVEKDAWLDSLEDSELDLIKSNKLKPIEETKKKEEETNEEEEISNLELKKLIVSILEEEETIPEALKRLNPKDEKFIKLSDASSKLLSNGYVDVYISDREQFIKEINEEEKKEMNDIKWEYKWNLNDSQVYGPFSTQQIQQWIDADMFKDYKIYIRKVSDDMFDDTEFVELDRVFNNKR